MKKQLIFFCVSALVLTSCSKNYYSHRSVNVEKNDLITTPVVTDLNVDLNKKVTAKSGERKTIAQAKDEAYFNAITNNNIDVLVDPVYNIVDKPTVLFFRRRAIAEVTGFSGKYTNVRNVTDAVKSYNMDTSHVKNFVMLTNTDKKTQQPSNFDEPLNPKKKGILAVLALAVTAVVLVIAGVI
jgi:hypothetical protein